jgi:predicted acyltransferase
VSEAGSPPKPKRIASLDALRGITIAGMLIVNTPGTWAHVYAPLLHAEWHGWTYTDTIFPSFLFVVGVSIVLSLGRRGHTDRSTFGHVLRRTAVIFGLGLALNIFAALLLDRAWLRIPGVLQRIAVCYFAAAAIYLWLGKRAVLPLAAVLLIGYWLLMTRVPVPGYGTGRLDVEGNLAAYIDRLVLREHTWKHDPHWDPEGILSTLPAVATTLLGVFAGLLLESREPIRRKILGLLAWGWLWALVGLAWNSIFPINKNLWTSSYALFMAGLACAALGVCVWAMDLRGWIHWAKPFVWLGSNALALFVAADAVAFILLAIHVGNPPRSLYAAIYQTVFNHFADPRLGSFLFALAYCASWIAVAGWMYRRRIFIKV